MPPISESKLSGFSNKGFKEIIGRQNSAKASEAGEAEGNNSIAQLDEVVEKEEGLGFMDP